MCAVAQNLFCVDLLFEISSWPSGKETKQLEKMDFLKMNCVTKVCFEIQW